METAEARTDAIDWPSLGASSQAAHEAAETQARLLARALAAHGIVTERDGAVEELDDRFDAVLETLWPKGRALDGYDLQSSLGAYAIAKVAFDLVPAGRTGLRHEPLDRVGLTHALVEHGADELAAASVLGDWARVSEGFTGDPNGLSPSVVAGLAERTLTRAERRAALDQIAVSPRCLNRLASTLNLIAAVRLLLPMLPPESAGPDVLIAVVGLALGRPDRIAQLYEGRSRSLRVHALYELAHAQWALLQAQPPELSDDPLAPAPALEARTPAPRSDTEVMGPPNEAPVDAASEGEGDADSDYEDEDEDDVLEIVEERVDPAADPERAASEAAAGPARWFAVDAEASPGRLEAHRAALAEHRTVVARAGELLGVRPMARPATVPDRPAPPDERLLAALDARAQGPSGDEEMTERIAIDPLLHGHELEVEGLPFDPVFPPVRGALRAVVACAEGRVPEREAIAAAGDLAWVLARARALGLLVQGELTEAQAAVAALEAASAPEGRWAADRALRFAGRAPEPVDPREARPVAGALAADLAQVLARTLAGTVGRGR